jgi:uncharacterized membrane protein
VHALSHVAALLGELVTHPPRPTHVRDDDGVLRLLVPQWDVDDLLALGLEEPVHFSSGQPFVLRRLAQLVREIAWRAPRGTLDAQLCEYLERVVRRAEDSTDVAPAEIAHWRLQVTDALAGRWPSTP